jgi:hypothetical protein
MMIRLTASFGFSEDGLSGLIKKFYLDRIEQDDWHKQAIIDNLEIPYMEKTPDVLIKQNTQVVANWKTFNVQKSIFREQANDTKQLQARLRGAENLDIKRKNNIMA